MESWKHSGLGAAIVIAAILIGGSLQAWSLAQDADPAVLPSVPKQALADAEISLTRTVPAETQRAASKTSIETAVANQFHGAKVNEMALVHVDDDTKRPQIHGPMWVVALDPALGEAMNRDPRTGEHLTSQPQFFLAFYDATSGEFRYAVSFGE